MSQHGSAGAIRPSESAGVASRSSELLISRRVVLVWIPLAASAVYFALLVLVPQAYPVLLFADLWLFGYAHVAASYLRVLDLPLAPSQRIFLFGDLLLVSFFVAFLMTGAAGAILLSSTYLYWQWFHYTRQAYGLTRLLDRNAAIPPITYVALFALPTAVFASSLRHSGSMFLQSRVLVPDGRLLTAVAVMASVFGMLALILAANRLRRQSWNGGSAVCFVSSAIVVLCFAYAILPLNQAWLVANVWHNVQYLLVVRLWSSSAQEAAGEFVTPIQVTKRFATFFALCLVAAVLLYGLLRAVLASSPLAGGLFIVAFYMAFNFHHYVLDSMIWKRRLRIPSTSVVGWCIGRG